jgi:ribulose 1,5-bisphosphate synthetase/thiazole synthase
VPESLHFIFEIIESKMAANAVYGPETLSWFLSMNFDYVIVGGGTAGLLLAARLTENPNI